MKASNMARDELLHVDVITDHEQRLCEYGEDGQGDGCQDTGLFRVTFMVADEGDISHLEVEMCGPHSLALAAKSLMKPWDVLKRV